MSEGVNDLARLAQERDKLRLGEVASWLHDWEKCIPYWRKLGARFNPSDVASILDSFRPATLLTATASFSLKEIILQGKHPSRAEKSSDWRIRLLGACHDLAHTDKPQLVGLGKETNLIGSVFGYETSSHEASLGLLGAVNHVNQRHIFLKELERAFNHALGDTRRPINEVTLWDWGAATAALWKAIAARYVLEGQTDGNFGWRILSVNFDGLGFLERALTIGDLLGRQSALQAALDDVRELLEVKYPLGNEVYRDENGSAFVVPALDGDDAEGNRLRRLIESHIMNTWRQSEVGEELQPRLHITEANKQAAVLHKALEMLPPPLTPVQDSLERWWQGEAADLCTACGVRPQGYGALDVNQKRKAQARNICYVCLDRRGRRAQIWAQARHKTGDESKPWERTIWSDEVADETARLALIVGKFDLSHWLNGDMIQTLLVVCAPAQNTYESKNPSFARIQRIWRTTQHFWQSVQDADIPSITRLQQRRLSIGVTNCSELQRQLGDYHAYEAEVNGRRFSVIWDSQDKCLLTADNLAAWIQDGAETLLKQLPNEFPLFEPGGYRQLRAELGAAKVDRDGSKVIAMPYSPTLTLLAQPASFMALVPANRALDVVHAIKGKYEREMGKVRNRLPLHLGVAYFHRRTPLRAALETGRQMLTYQSPAHRQLWRVGPLQKGTLPVEKEALAHGTRQFDETITLALTQNAHTITWHVPVKMGDGQTEDVWYPYVFVETQGDNSKIKGRQRAIRSQRPAGNSQTSPCWLVHAADLREGDEIYFSPSTFDFEFLDTTARRFEIHYDSDGRRPRRTRPFYLEDMDRLDELWTLSAWPCGQ